MSKLWFTSAGIVRDWRILKAIGEKYGLEFDRKHKYHIGDTYKNNRGEDLSDLDMEHNGIRYKLEYFNGCFHPFLLRKKDTDE